jgi:hypothetical protein
MKDKFWKFIKSRAYVRKIEFIVSLSGRNIVNQGINQMAFQATQIDSMKMRAGRDFVTGLKTQGFGVLSNLADKPLYIFQIDFTL